MEFSSLNTKDAAERGAELHLRHPVYAHPLYSGGGTDADGRWTDKAQSPDPITVTVRGVESRSVQDRLKRLQRNRVKGKEADAEETGLEFVCSLVIGFSGLTKGGEPMRATDARAFFEQSDDLVEQVIDFAKERSNFFGDASSR